MDYGVPEQNAVYGEEEPHYEANYQARGGNYDSVDNVGDSAGMKQDSSSSAGKLFVGGIAWETSEESFQRYFGKYGEISDSVIMIDKISGRPRGFGFITFSDPEVAEKVLQEDHVIDGRAVEVKRTVPREDVHGRGVLKTKKIFVGGIPLSLSQDSLREYFSSYGNIVEYQIMLEHKTGKSRGFGFVTFENEEAVDKIFSDGRMHELSGKQVEIKRAEPKRSGVDFSTENRSRRGGGSSRSSGNFTGGSEGFGASYGAKMGRGYGGYGGYSGYGGYGNFPRNYASDPSGFYPGYGGYGYGYGFGGSMYGGGYGGGGFGGAVGYGGVGGAGGAGSYGVGRGFGGPDGGFDGVNGFGGSSSSSASGSGVGYGPTRGYGGGAGGYGTGKAYGNAMNGRFHPYRK